MRSKTKRSSPGDAAPKIRPPRPSRSLVGPLLALLAIGGVPALVVAFYPEESATAAPTVTEPAAPTVAEHELGGG